MIIQLKGNRHEFPYLGHFVDLSRLGDDSIIVDAGASYGLTIKELRKFEQTKNCTIYAIEPHKKNVKDLKKLKNVVVCNKALVGQEFGGEVLFGEVAGLQQWGYIAPSFEGKRRHGRPGSKYTVKTLKINDVFKEFNIPHIDYLKTDIEGSEKEVIETMSQETASKIKQWSFMIHPTTPENKAYLREKLEKLGFEIYKEETYREVFCGRQ